MWSWRQDSPLRLALLIPSLLTRLGKTGTEPGMLDGRPWPRREFVDYNGIVKFVIVKNFKDLGMRLSLWWFWWW